jgi:putative nucleotidyltransferase with HDIG domain
LLTDAPGTYHHSVIVANLAERAAHIIGADAMLARVGAYYHDIGKVVHPYQFVENQMDGTNVHDQLDPKTSAQLIIAHVKDGLALAQRHGLPSKVRDIIEQHHGTGWAGFFYVRAKEGTEGDDPNLDPAPFRYPGPRPQTTEAAIVMLADSVEATVRSSRDHSPSRIDELVAKAINDRLGEGQLNESDLTLRDLDLIREAFVAVLQGIFHPRLEYPEAESNSSPLRILERMRDDARSRLRGGS